MWCGNGYVFGCSVGSAGERDFHIQGDAGERKLCIQGGAGGKVEALLLITKKEELFTVSFILD